MGVLSDLEPRSVFHYFEEITKIPHGSGNVEQISDYLKNFAGERGIFCIQDELKNIIMIKEASEGYEREPAVILQGHMDMVAVKKPDCGIDMKTQGLQVAVEGDKVYAEGTSLGGDDGIAVAYCLALLDSDTIRHPRLEVVITVDEEVGMDGAREIDLSLLTGSRMINLDSEEEGIFLTSCAGGARVKCRLRLPLKERAGIFCTVTMGGLQGGHSGGEIHKERGNANALLSRLLYKTAGKLPLSLISAGGGLADNAIPREARALLLVPGERFEELESLVKTVEREVREELSVKDPGFFLRLEKGERGSFSCLSPEDTRRTAAFLQALPNGVQAMSSDIPGLVETSLNLGILKLAGINAPAVEGAGANGLGAEDSAANASAGNAPAVPDSQKDQAEVLAEFSVRSSMESAKAALIERLRAVTELAGGSIQVTGDYPGWKFRRVSPLREKMTALYEKMYGRPPRLEAIHAGLECGILGSKIKDLDCVSLGPDMRDIHTTEETLSISSTKRVWEYLVALLDEKET